MKKLLFILALLAYTLLSCNKDKDDLDKPDDLEQPETPAGTTLSLSMQDLVFDAAGGWKEFTINCSGAWTLTGGNAWCQSGATSGSGKSQVKVMTEASTLTSDRNVNLTIRSGSQAKVLAVTQKGVNALTLAKDKFDLSAEGGDLTVTLQANVECTSTIPAAFQSWIKKAPGTKAMTSQSFRFTVSPNESTEKREGYIVFNGGTLKDTIRVYQTGKTPAEESQLILSKDTYDLSAEAQEITVDLQTNIDYEVTVPDSVSGWVHYVDTRALRTDKLHFSITENEGDNARSAVVIIREQGGALTDTLHIRQAVQEPEFYLVFKTHKKVFSSIENIITTIPVHTNVPYEVIVRSGVNKWPNVYIGNNGELRCGTSKNLTGKPRYGMVIVKEKDGILTDTLHVTQAACTDSQSIDYQIKEEGEEITIDVDEKNYKVTFPDVFSQWVTMESEDTEDGQRFVFTFSPNETDSLRYCYAIFEDPSGIFIDTLQMLQIKNIQIPDPEFKRYLTGRFDKDKDGKINLLEAEQVTEIDLRAYKYSSLEGIQYFKNLKKLELNQNAVLSSLDLSGNTELEYLNCSNNSLKFLDLSHNPKLITLYCYSNLLANLDLSNQKNLEKLSCFSNPLTSLDLSNNSNLKDLSCSFNESPSLDVSNLLKLEKLSCSSSSLSSLDVSNLSNLVSLNLRGEKLSSLTFLNNQKLQELELSNTQLTSLDLSQVPDLRDLDCSFNNFLTSINLSNNRALIEVTCIHNQLIYIDLSQAQNMTTLWCYSNQLTSLDLPQSQKLTDLRCYDNKLVSADFSRLPNLRKLYCGSNQLTILELPDNTNLEELLCGSNPWISIKICKNLKLRKFYLSAPTLQSLVLDCAKLEELSCDAQLTSFDLSYAPKLYKVNCSRNQLTSLDLSNAPNLKILDCYGNLLQSLIINSTKLTELSCSDNQLTSLDLPYSPDLTKLSCYDNQLTSIDLSHTPQLKKLDCSKNRLITIDLSCMPRDFELVCRDMPTLRTVYTNSWDQRVDSDSGVDEVRKECE